MRIFSQAGQVADTKMAGTGAEGITKSEGTEGGVAASTAAANGQALAVSQATLDKVLSAVDAVINIYNTPLIFEALAIGSAIARAATIIYIQDSEAPAGPELNTEREGAGSCGSGSAMTNYQQGREFASG